MKTKFSLFFLFTSINVLFSQNLIPNGDFETITMCPLGASQIYLALPWDQPLNTGSSSPDLFNSCNTDLLGIPNNYQGYQNAYSGVGYAGISCFGANYREYIQVQLTKPLSAGVIYEARMYVSPSEKQGVGINRIGMHISTGRISGDGGPNLLPYVPQIANPTNLIITDTLNWTLVSGFYTAFGGEDYITIGNFFDDAHTDTLTFMQSINHYCYLMLDDVSLSVANSTKIFEVPEEEVISIYPNPFFDKLNIICKDFSDCEFLLYDLTSKIVLRKEFINSLTITTEALHSGVYYYELRNNNLVVKHGKVFKTE